jgi:cytochrome bd-type quinol oxidase subunit 2
MGQKARASARTPKTVHVALWVNLLLLVVALVAPRMTANASEASALFFVIPMALILVVGAAAAIGAYILARREDLRLRWTAFLPISVFLLGIAGTLLLVYVKFV